MLLSLASVSSALGNYPDNEQQKKCAEAWYLHFRNAAPIYIADSKGHKTKRIGDFLKMDVPGVTYHSLSAYDAEIILWPSETYTLTWTMPKSVGLSLEIVKGCDIDVPNEAVRYEGVQLAAGTKVKLKIGRSGPIYLRYDKNMNGRYEGTIKPEFIAHGVAARDVTGPGIGITSEKIDNSKILVRITAIDPSGIHNLSYFTDEDGPDGHMPHKYTEPFTIDPGKIKVITAFSSDGVGNSSVVSKAVVDEFIVRIGYSFNGIVDYEVDLALQSYNGKEPYTVDWDFGDGKTQSGIWVTASNTYQKPGKYKVVLTVTDSSGRKAQDSMTVTLPAK